MANEFFNKWSQPESDDRLELVFGDRNRSYGAFFIRAQYRKSKVISTLVAIAFVAFVSAVPLIQEMNKNRGKGKSKTVKVETQTIEEIDEPEEKQKEEAPPPEPPKQQVAEQAFAQPTFDPNTTNEADLPPNNQVTNPGQNNIAGSNDGFQENSNNNNPGPFDPNGGNQDPVKADVQAKFVGGDDAFIEFVKANFQYPARCQDEGINGSVLLRFVVNTKGKVSNISVIEETASCKEFTAEAIRVLQSSPDWIPGMVNGKFVKSYRVVPISLRLD